jgi:hypothetical protein
MADPDLVDLAIERGALTTAGNQFNTTQRDVLHGFDSPAAPFLGLRPTNCIAGVAGRPCTFEEKEGHHFQMFDPATGSVTKLAKTTVSRGLHGTATLLPDATVFFAGENREALVRPDDLSFPLASSYAGILPRGDPDLGVPVGQVFSPAYLFEKGGGRSSRPKIVHAPGEIGYEGHFDLRIADRADEIGSVVLLRSDHNTHSLTTGDRYVKLGFVPTGPAGNVRVTTPKFQGQAVPGVYLLFVVDKRGVPSIGQRVDLKP